MEEYCSATVSLHLGLESDLASGHGEFSMGSNNLSVSLLLFIVCVFTRTFELVSLAWDALELESHSII